MPDSRFNMYFNLEQISSYISEYYLLTIFTLIGLTLISLTVLYVLRWRDYLLPYRLSRQGQQTPNIAQTQPTSTAVTVVVPLHQLDHLSKRLIAALLEQDYSNYEMVVVDQDNSEATKAYIEQIQLRHKQVRYSFIPHTASGIDSFKLAVTLGVRAARSPWIALTSPQACPISAHWLSDMAEHIEPQLDVLLGYANYTDDGSPHARKAVLDRLLKQLRYYRSATGYGCIGGDSANLWIRKTAFLEQKGFEGPSDYGCDGLVDALATPLNVGMVVSPTTTVREVLPAFEEWQRLQVIQRKQERHLSKRGRYYALRESAATLFHYAFCCNFGAYALFRIFTLWQGLGTAPLFLTADIGMLLLVGLFFAVPVWLIQRSLSALQETNRGGDIIKRNFSQPFYNFRLSLKSWRLES